jgi:hypothetical protein
MKKIAFLILLPLCAQALIAEDKSEESSGIAFSNELVLQVSSLPEMKLGFTNHFVFPFLQSENPLTEGNNIDLALTAEISPISLNGIAEIIWTPIAFFQLTAGGKIGSGWNIELFGGEIYGIGINQSGNNGYGEIDGSAFDGLLWKTQLGGVIQFDLAAIFPGDWNHIVARSYHEINYKGYSRAKENEAWYFEADDGENCNGFNYYGNFLIGYQMPIFLNLAALLAEMDLYLYDTPNRAQWGDDLIRWTFSAIFNFSFTEKLSLTLITQFRTRRNYLDTNWQDLYYRNRTINDSDPLYLEFYRVAAALTYKFK